jgi:uncharacterized membrane protein YeaQ/YmgE (transglycosylase-associated protein family)
MNLWSLVFQLIAGAIGGNVAGAVLKDKSLGSLGNTIAGIVGGGVGGKLLSYVLGGAAAEAATGFNVTAFIEQIVGGGLGGAIVMALVGIIKNMKQA